MLKSILFQLEKGFEKIKINKESNERNIGIFLICILLTNVGNYIVGLHLSFK